MGNGKKCCDNKLVTVKISNDQNTYSLLDFQLPFLESGVPVFLIDFNLSVRCAAIGHPQFYSLPPPLLVDRIVRFANFRI